ncbi:MAG: 2Fe-2S iron-sulfur cluster-binding protein, partial [Candidatus Microthrix parvicella]
MKLLLRVWRQRRADQPGAFEEYPVPDAAPDMTVLELLDRLNETLAERGVDPIAFDSDCREGICGACGITIDGVPHGPVANVATCNQHVRSFADGATVTLEPFRAGSFPVVRDLVVD